MILKAIIAVFFSLLIQPTLMASFDPTIIREEAKYLWGPLNEACFLFQNTACGRQRVHNIRFDDTVDLSPEKLCSTVTNVFCQVNKSLKMLDHNICRDSPLFRIEDSKFLNQSGRCNLPDDRITMKDFCIMLMDYVQRLYNRC